MEPIIDYETGEIIETEHRTPEDVLPRLARTIRALDLEIERLNKYKETEVARIVESVDFKTHGLEERRGTILAMSQDLLAKEQTSFRDYPGIGKFQVRKSPDSVDSAGYESLTHAQQQTVMATYPDLFQTTVTTRPIKKSILSALKHEPVPGFALVNGEKRIYFTKE